MNSFKTIGNATLIVLENDKPLLSTDPWLYGNPYFGSWGHKYKIPQNELSEIINSKYIWLSHGHPDHIDGRSFSIFKGKTILIPDHYGDRIYKFSYLRCVCIQITHSLNI